MARFFSGSRESSGKGGAASTVMREQLKKGGKVDLAENYKKMLQKKLAEAKLKAASGEGNKFSMIGSGAAPQPRSKRAQAIVKMMAERDLAKEAKKARKAVVVEAKKFANGSINDKGKIYDSAGNVIAQVNLKNGNMTTMYGQSIGHYVPKSYMTKIAIEQAITKNSPYLLNQRKMVEAKKQEQSQQSTSSHSQSNHFWNAPQNDIWGNPISDFFGKFF